MPWHLLLLFLAKVSTAMINDLNVATFRKSQSNQSFLFLSKAGTSLNLQENDIAWPHSDPVFENKSAQFAAIANCYESDITVSCNNAEADGKVKGEIEKVLDAELEKGTVVTISATGPDEDRVILGLTGYLENLSP